jgi:hypothetical protein
MESRLPSIVPTGNHAGGGASAEPPRNQVYLLSMNGGEAKRSRI